MNIIKRLIIKEWLRFFSASVFVLFLLLTTANLVSGFLRRNVTPLEVILNHLIETPTHFKLILPVSCLVASLFAINKLKNRNELTAIYSIGFGRKKLILTIFQISAIVGLFQLLVSGYIDPFTKSHRHHIIQDSEAKFRNLKSKGLKSSTVGSGLIWYKSDEYFFSFSKYDRLEKKLIDLSIYFYTNNMVKKIIYAPYAKYDGKKWMIPNGREILNLNDQNFPHENILKDITLPITEELNDFKQLEADITTLNIVKLYRYIDKLSEKGINVNEYLVLLLEKISASIICILFAITATTLSFNSNKRNSSTGKNLFFIFVFIIVYWLVNSYFIELGKNSKLDPYLACFSVPAIFFLFISGFFIHHRKLR